MPRSRALAPTHERILDEVERLIAAKGVYGFKLKDVAEPLNVRVPAIYKHYKSRDDVLIEVSRRFIGALAGQFRFDVDRDPVASLRAALDEFVTFKMSHPAYVRLALTDFATPGGGMEYIKIAAGGSFEDNFSSGPLASMHKRLGQMLRAARRTQSVRPVKPSDFYRIIKAALLFRLVFPDDALLLRKPTPAEVRRTQRWLWDVACRMLTREFVAPALP